MLLQPFILTAMVASTAIAYDLSPIEPVIRDVQASSCLSIPSSALAAPTAFVRAVDTSSTANGKEAVGSTTSSTAAVTGNSVSVDPASSNNDANSAPSATSNSASTLAAATAVEDAKKGGASSSTSSSITSTNNASKQTGGFSGGIDNGSAASTAAASKTSAPASASAPGTSTSSTSGSSSGKGASGGGGGGGAGAGGGSNSTTGTNANSGSITDKNNNNNNNNNNTTVKATSSSLNLDAANVQTGSQSDGLGGSVEPGQSASSTDKANFINFCSGQLLTNGLQQKGGSCNGIVMGQIPSTSNMISTIITNPSPGGNIPPNESFNVNLQVTNLAAGSFTNATITYYSAPQQLKNGIIVGHTHVSIQTLGNDLATLTPPDPTKFVFFKGINDAGDGKGGLTAVVTGGLPAGVYRVCTLTSASNHQPVLMPVAQRGAQDDCTKFTVGGAGGNTGSNGGGNSGNKAVAVNTNTATNGTTSAAPSTTTENSGSAAADGSVKASTNTKNSTASAGSGKSSGFSGGRRGRFVMRNFVA